MTPAKKAPKKAAKHSEHVASDAGKIVAVIGGKPVATHGRTFTGKVTSDRMTKTVTVEWERQSYVSKYQRYEKRSTSVKAHDETGAKIGDIVEIMETRPISKTKHFIVTKKITT